MRGTPGQALTDVERVPTGAGALTSDDLHLALYLCYELSYGGIDGVNDRWEWDPALISFRAALETSFESAIRDAAASAPAVAYFDEHVEADAVHESIAANDLAGGLVATEPGLEADVLFGARALLATEAAFAHHLLQAWDAGRSSLRRDPISTAA